MSVYIYFNWSIHANHTQSPDNFRGIGDLLRSKEELIIVVVPAIIESFESVRGEADRCCGCKVQSPRIKEVKKGIL